MSYADTVKTTLQDFADGKMIPYNPLNPAIEMAEMFGFIKRKRIPHIHVISFFYGDSGI